MQHRRNDGNATHSAVDEIRRVALIADPASRVRQASVLRREVAVAASETFRACLYQARLDGLSWEDLSAAAGVSIRTVKAHVYAEAVERGEPKPIKRYERPAITEWFDARVTHEPRPGARRRHRQV